MKVVSGEVQVAIYCRVSTQDQSCELQKQELGAFIEARGWKLHTIYEEKVSGTSTKRPLLQAMLKDARERKFSGVLVWKLDRFARSLKDLITMLQELHELGIAFTSLKDQFDLSTSAGRLMMHMIGAFSEFEASLIRERVRAGVQAARAKGKKLGRPKTRDDATILGLRTQGLSIRQIATQLKTSTASVQRALAVTKSYPRSA